LVQDKKYPSSPNPFSHKGRRGVVMIFLPLPFWERARVRVMIDIRGLIGFDTRLC